MKATRCDRCKQYFDGEIGRITYQKGSDQEYYNVLDICPDCMEAFFSFIRKQQPEEMDAYLRDKFGNTFSNYSDKTMSEQEAWKKGGE